MRIPSIIRNPASVPLPGIQGDPGPDFSLSCADPWVYNKNSFFIIYLKYSIFSFVNYLFDYENGDFSLGIIAYKIMTGRFPFAENLTQAELTKKIQEGKFDFSPQIFVGYSERAIQIVREMLDVNPGPVTGIFTVSKSVCAYSHQWPITLYFPKMINLG